MEPRIQYAKTEDGVSIAYYVLGAGEPLIQMPAGPTSHIQLEWQSPRLQNFTSALAEGRTLIRYDGRGTGLSDENTEPLSLESLLLDLRAVVDAVQVETFSLLASTLGGPPAIAYAARNPDRVSNLLLWCTSVRNTEVSGGPSDQALGALRESDWHLYTEVLAFITYGWDAGDAGKAFAKRVRELMTPEKHRRCYAEMYRIDASDEAPKVRSRTLIMQRESARLATTVMTGGRSLAATIPGAQLLILEGESGPITTGNQQATIAAINEFLGDVSAAPPAGDVHTILFTDMQSSTTITHQLGDAAAQEVRHTHNDIVRSALSANGGSEIKHTGDGIMASFTTASAALDSAIAIQRAVAAHRDEHPESPLAVYVGINAGEPIAEDDDLFGTSVDLAARICDHAEPGQILASNVVRELAEGKDFLFGDIGDVVLKGFEEPVRLYEVRWRAEM